MEAQWILGKCLQMERSGPFRYVVYTASRGPSLRSHHTPTAFLEEC